MNKYELDFTDGTHLFIEADYYNKDRSGKNLTEFIDWEYIFYRNGREYQHVPCYWLMDKPKLVKE